MAKWRSENTERVRAFDRDRGLRNRYGLTSESVTSMQASQGNACAICLQPAKAGSVLGVDHCHSSGKVRGLLCHPCNTALGLMKDDSVRMVRAAAYINRHAA